MSCGAARDELRHWIGIRILDVLFFEVLAASERSLCFVRNRSSLSALNLYRILSVSRCTVLQSVTWSMSPVDPVLN